MIRKDTVYAIMNRLLLDRGIYEDNYYIESILKPMNNKQVKDFVFSFFDYFKDEIDWVQLSQYKYLSEEFIAAFKNELDWNCISNCQSEILSEDFIDKYKKYLNYSYVCSKKQLSEDFIRNHSEDIDWHTISIYQNLSKDFIKEFKDKIDFYYLFRDNKYLTKDAAIEFSDNFYFPEVFNKHSGEKNFMFSIDEIKSLSDKNVNISNCANCCNLSYDFIDKNADKLNWVPICRRIKLTEDFIEKHLDKIDWNEISYCQNLSEDFIRKHKDKINWKYISSSRLSEDFIREFSHLIDWESLSSRSLNEFSDKFILDFKDRLRFTQENFYV